MGGRREVSIVSHRPVTSSDLILQLVVACFKEFAGGFKPIRKGEIFCINK